MICIMHAMHATGIIWTKFGRWHHLDQVSVPANVAKSAQMPESRHISYVEHARWVGSPCWQQCEAQISPTLQFSKHAKETKHRAAAVIMT
jgi:hypothetical protein